MNRKSLRSSRRQQADSPATIVVPPRGAQEFHEDEQMLINARKWQKWVVLVALVIFVLQLSGGLWAKSGSIIAFCVMWTFDIISYAVSELVLHVAIERGGILEQLMPGSLLKAEIVGKLVSLAVVWALNLWVFVYATRIWLSPDEVQSGKMLIVGLVSLVFNFRD